MPSPTPTMPGAPSDLPKGLTLAEEFQLPDPSYSEITAVAFSPDGKSLAVGALFGKESQLWGRDEGGGWCSARIGEERIRSLDWRPDGSAIAVGEGSATSGIGSVTVWKFESRKLVLQWAIKPEVCYVVRWAPNGRFLAAGFYAPEECRSIKIFDAATGEIIHSMDNQSLQTYAVTWLNDHALVATSSGIDIAIWDVKKFEKLKTMGCRSRVLGVVADRERGKFWSITDDRTIRLWDGETGQQLALHEGLKAHGVTISASAHAPLLVVLCHNGDIVLLHSQTLTVLAQFIGSKGTVHGALSFHPQRPLLATIGTDKTTIRLIAYDTDALGLETTVRETTRYTNAKVILLGDTGVGKSGLSHQLVHGCYAHTVASHARRAHLLSSEVVEAPEGGKIQRDILLWDLAGQPAYRLVHQLSVEGATLACVLCDSRSESNPLEGASYWAQVLAQARSSVPVTKFLVAARIDAGGQAASPERMEQFAREHGFHGFFKTSAFSGEGCAELRAAITAAIPWGQLPPVSSTELLLAVRRFIQKLKDHGGHGSSTAEAPQTPELRTIGQLHQAFAKDHGKPVELDDFVSCLERLEQTDVIDLLIFRAAGEAPTASTAVLLDPTRVDAYASAILVAAKDEPDGPGHLEESRVLSGDFKLEARERMGDKAAEKLVLWYVLESLLQRDLALPETIKKCHYLVFPAQCTTELRYPDKDSFGVALEFSGPVRSIYATLIAQFAHYAGFSRREFFHDAARYHSDHGGHCVVRLQDHGTGSAELHVSFDAKVPAPVRTGFLEFIRQHLAQRSVPNSLRERHVCHCAHCHEKFDDRLVRKRIEGRKHELLCPYCEKTTPLVNLLAPATPASTEVATQMQEDAKVGRQKITAAWIIKSKEQQGRYDVFLSHNSKDKKEVEAIAKSLMSKGIRPWLDKWDLVPGDTIKTALAKAIETIPCAILFFGPADTGKWHILEISAYIEEWANGNARMIPAVLPGVEATPEMPIWVRQNLWVDLRDWQQPRSDAFYRLVCGIINRKPGSSPRLNFTAGEVLDWTGE
jgi:WD40 repeat protein